MLRLVRFFSAMLLLCLLFGSCVPRTPVSSDEASADDTKPTVERQLRLDGRRYSYNGNAEDIAVQDDLLTICVAGDYRLSGVLDEGAIAVSVEQHETVRLILDGVSITSSCRAPLSVICAAAVILELSPGTVNTLTDAPRAQSETPSLLPGACVQVNSHLRICGEGTLVLRGRQHTALAVSESLTVASGTITAVAVETGVWVRDRFLLQNGSLTVTAASCGIVTDNSAGTQGEIRILGGRLVASCKQIALCAGKCIAALGGSGSLQAPILYQCRYWQDGQTVTGSITVSSAAFPAVPTAKAITR